MDDESIQIASDKKAARWIVSILALILIGIEVSLILRNYEIVHMYARPDQTRLFDAVDHMAVAHGIRIAVISTLILGWRWSLWVSGLSLLAVYIPNPWVSGAIMNSMPLAVFFVPLIVVAGLFDKRLLFPWRSRL